MQAKIRIFIGVVILTLFCNCDEVPEEEIQNIRKVMDSVIAEKVNLSNPVDFYYLQDSVYKVLEEIERKKSKLFPAKYDKETEQLKELISQIKGLSICSRKTEDILINDVNTEMDSIQYKVTN